MITYFSMEGFLSVKDKAEIYFVPRRIHALRIQDLKIILFRLLDTN